MSFKQLETTLVLVFRIQPDRVSTFRSRIKQLQRLEFPSGVNVGRGSKMAYGTDHLFKMVIAFELISLGLPALTATQLTENSWRTIAAGLALSAIQARTVRKSEEQKTGAIFLQFKLHSMSELQFSRGWGGSPQPSTVSIVDTEYLVPFMKPGGMKENPLWLLLNCNDLIKRVLSVASDQAGVRHASVYNDEFAKWLPQGCDRKIFIHMRGPYPDKSNLELRRQMHRYWGCDPGSVELGAEEEAQDFLKTVVLNELPF